jgi:hypothetical protein
MTIDIFLRSRSSNFCTALRAFHAIVVSHSGVDPVVRHRGFDVAALPK